jgi:DNA (cytosine-5)-methyltransferase 1
MPGDSTSPLSFYEFFAGGGLARLGLEPRWTCLFANDIDPAKAEAYGRAFGQAEMRTGDVWGLTPTALPPGGDLAWASFPCQDLSLAGSRGGLAAPRSGAFWGFWRLIQALGSGAPPVIALENVPGLLTSHGGADFETLLTALRAGGYRTGALSIDAGLFVPQSRRRTFIVATRGPVPAALLRPSPSAPFHDAPLIAAAPRADWIWWRAPEPPRRSTTLADQLEPDDAVRWDAPAKTMQLLALLAPRQRASLERLRAAGGRRVGAAFRRIRIENGRKVQRLEARFDGLAGCLRTPAGGSSRQTLLVIDNGAVRSRLISPRECARLMGAPDDYPLPRTATGALHLMGDAVVAPVVRHLSETLLTPLALAARAQRRAA